jgi:hypothetical protein
MTNGAACEIMFIGTPTYKVVNVDGAGVELALLEEGGNVVVSGAVTADAGSGPWPVTDNGTSLTVDTTGMSGLEVVQTTAADLNATVTGTVAAIGPDAVGATPTGDPVQISGVNLLGEVTRVRLADDGDMIVHPHSVMYVSIDGVGATLNVPVDQSDTDPLVFPSFLWAFNGASWDRVRGDSTDGLLVNLGTNNDAIKTASRSVVDANNSSVVELAANADFTGTGTDVLDYAMVSVFVDASVDSDPAGVRLEFSTDNTNWDESLTYFYDATYGARRIHAPVSAQYFRVVYQNGGTTQVGGHFRLSTLLHPDASIPEPPTRLNTEHDTIAAATLTSSFADTIANTQERNIKSIVALNTTEVDLVILLDKDDAATEYLLPSGMFKEWIFADLNILSPKNEVQIKEVSAAATTGNFYCTAIYD